MWIHLTLIITTLNNHNYFAYGKVEVMMWCLLLQKKTEYQFTQSIIFSLKKKRLCHQIYLNLSETRTFSPNFDPVYREQIPQTIKCETFRGLKSEAFILQKLEWNCRRNLTSSAAPWCAPWGWHGLESTARLHLWHRMVYVLAANTQTWSGISYLTSSA